MIRCTRLRFTGATSSRVTRAATIRLPSVGCTLATRATTTLGEGHTDARQHAFRSGVAAPLCHLLPADHATGKRAPRRSRTHSTHHEHCNRDADQPTRSLLFRLASKNALASQRSRPLLRENRATIPPKRIRRKKPSTTNRGPRQPPLNPSPFRHGRQSIVDLPCRVDHRRYADVVHS